MEEATEGIAVPAGDHADLMPDGSHIMLMMLKRELEVGDEVEITLHFSDGGSLVVEAAVKESGPTHLHSPSPSAEASS
jgi:copper(I)-binding protein